MTTDLLTSLATYIRVLSEAAEQTNLAEDRPAYTRHLAVSAQMFVAVYHDASLETLRTLVASERRSYGWSYLVGDPGVRAERAFDAFATSIEDLNRGLDRTWSP